MKKLAQISFSICLLALGCSPNKNKLHIGSKHFTESYVIAEIMAQVVEAEDEAQVVREFGMGATGIVIEALKRGSIDLYPEYTGTISEALVKNMEVRDLEGIRRELTRYRLIMSNSLGFSDNYALAIPRKLSVEKNILKMSDLSKTDLTAGLTHEFMKRADGYNGIVKTYGLKFHSVTAMEHTLAYQALGHGKIDITDVYTTDAEIETYDLKVLEDDKKFFPAYVAVMLAREDVPNRFPKSWAALKRLEGTLTEKEIIHLNGEAQNHTKKISDIAAEFLKKKSTKGSKSNDLVDSLILTTRQHFYLVLTSLLLSIIVGIPLGILAVKYSVIGQVILLVSSIVETIPSLALLCFLIPVFGIGTPPALVALFLYGLLPIVLGTFTGIRNLDPRLLEIATSLGLTPWQRLRLVEIPLAFPHILSGIKTSCIINIGTATLAALIGAGGYGSPIISGLALNHIPTILQGAIPAAAMALLAHGLFDFVEKFAVKKY